MADAPAKKKVAPKKTGSQSAAPPTLEEAFTGFQDGLRALLTSKTSTDAARQEADAARDRVAKAQEAVMAADAMVESETADDAEMLAALREAGAAVSAAIEAVIAAHE